MTDAKTQSSSKTGEKNEQGVAPLVSAADNSGQPGKIVDLKDADKPDPTTIAQEQIVDE